MGFDKNVTKFAGDFTTLKGLTAPPVTNVKVILYRDGGILELEET